MLSDPNLPPNDNADKSMIKPEWQKGLKLSFELSSWLIGPLVFALFLGNWLDEKYQTKPWLFLLCTAIAFGITCFGIVFKTITYIKEIENLGNQKSDLTKKEVKDNDK